MQRCFSALEGGTWAPVGLRADCRSQFGRTIWQQQRVSDFAEKVVMFFSFFLLAFCAVCVHMRASLCVVSLCVYSRSVRRLLSCRSSCFLLQHLTHTDRPTYLRSAAQAVEGSRSILIGHVGAVRRLKPAGLRPSRTEAAHPWSKAYVCLVLNCRGSVCLFLVENSIGVCRVRPGALLAVADTLHFQLTRWEVCCPCGN